MICGTSCTCEDFTNISERFKIATAKFLLHCEKFTDHPLNEIVPVRMPFSNHFLLPHCRTDKRLRSFVPYSCMLVNELFQSL